MYLVGFKNRFTTMLHWAVSFVFRGRSQRTTTRQQIVARTRLARLEAEQAQLQEAAVESSAAAVVDERGVGAGKESEVVETDSVDQLSAAYGDKDAEDPDTAPLKQAPES
jgi:NADH dehydrogenase